MKTHQQNFARALLILLAVVGVACQKKSDGGGSVQPAPMPPPPAFSPYNQPNCNTCFGNGQLIASAVGTYGGTQAMQLKLDLLGDPSRGYDFNNPKVAIVYNGPVFVQGQMMISIPFVESCNLPSGLYDVHTLNPGNMTSATVYNLVIEAVYQSNPNIRTTMAISPGILYSTGPTGTSKVQPNSFGANVDFQTINGQPCSQGIVVTY